MAKASPQFERFLKKTLNQYFLVFWVINSQKTARGCHGLEEKWEP
jgi:hypothetical protein